MNEDFPDDLEALADELLDATFELSDAEVSEIVGTIWPDERLRERLYELAHRTAENYEASSRPKPQHLEDALADLSQLHLPLKIENDPPARKVLLIDDDCARSIMRTQAFLKWNIEVQITVTATEGLACLKDEIFSLVIVQYTPTSEQESKALIAVQEFNVRVPVINVDAWANLAAADRQLLRLAARVLRKRVPPMPSGRKPPIVTDSAVRREQMTLLAGESPTDERTA